jgi:glutamate-1-semialdehyde 2,1-aminomutase
MDSGFLLDSKLKRDLSKSNAHFARAAQKLPLGVCGTYRFWGEDRTIYMAKAKGAKLWDFDGNEYVDFHLGWGPVILGHGDDRVDEAARAAIAIGGNSALASPLEIGVAERMSAMVPGAEQVRFANFGTEAVATALRIARAATGREGFVMVEGASLLSISAIGDRHPRARCFCAPDRVDPSRPADIPRRPGPDD